MNEIGSFWELKFENGKPVKPSTATVDINLVGTMYSTSVISGVILGGDSPETLMGSCLHQPPT